MKYLDFKNYFQGFPVISINEIRKIEPNFDLRRLSEWQAKGYIKKIIKGFYFFTDTNLNDYFLYAISNQINRPSYISLETAFSYYNFIPEAVFSVTAVTTKKTNNFNTGIGSFSYRHIKKTLFFAYDVIEIDKKLKFKIAEPEKAILDFLYLNTSINSLDDIKGLRLSKEALREKLNLEKLKVYLKVFQSKKLELRIEILESYLVGVD